MSQIGKAIGKVLMLVFACATIAFTSWMTLLLAQRMIPTNTILQFMTLILFDAAALIWFITFVTQATGTWQWAVAGIGFGVGLIGSIIMAAGELVLGQQLVVVDDPTRLGWVLVSTVIVAALMHASMIYAYHFLDPSVKNRIENAQKVSEAVEHAYKDARNQIDYKMDELTAKLVDSVMFEAEQQLSLLTAGHLRRGNDLGTKTGVIEVPSRDMPAERQTPLPPVQWAEDTEAMPKIEPNPTSPLRTENSRKGYKKQ